MSVAAVVLAAGLGVRMRSQVPKVLQPLASLPLIEHILQTLDQVSTQQTIIVHSKTQAELIKKTLVQYSYLDFAEQTQQLGTADAVLQAMPKIQNFEKVLILSGDVPLLQASTIRKLINASQTSELCFVTETLNQTKGLGRIVRDKQNNVLKIVEEKDASETEKSIPEINAGIYLVSRKHLQKWLPKISPQNNQKEYYLTDIIPLAIQEGVSIQTVSPEESWEVLGANTKAELAGLERQYQKNQAQNLMEQGLTLLDPERFDLRGALKFGQDVSIDVNVILEGELKFGNNVKIGPNVLIRNSILEDGVQVFANSIIEGAIIGKGSTVGPFARIRPETKLGENVKIGNFVELKKSEVGSGTKINHLSYVGDAHLGQDVNVGAGTITCNYDGHEKHQTTIGDRVFIGSDTQLIAPISIGEGVTIGAGTTLAKDVPPFQLIHNRIAHRVVENFKQQDEASIEKKK